ncbi:hypothetical protein E6R60_32870 [Streptomyces sp. A0642]|uniref:hypothetical protein n=1 Tax=unclassified Streptomyces TaxID=2593676 RepID=UPI0010A1FBF2|nr:hypothetical protein [Streptomyces sp. A0642]THA65738.1 hypothetical protein E6R60_32870 [Streptomyces sp. A0642]
MTQGLPGGFMSQQEDLAGTATDRTYTRISDGTVLVSDSISETANSQQATHIGTPGVTASQNNTYDKACCSTHLALPMTAGSSNGCFRARLRWRRRLG